MGKFIIRKEKPMGLDNSIVVRTTLSNGNTYEQDICYWRNKWKIRDKILDIIKPKDETGEYIINKGDLIDIEKLLLDLCKNYDEHSDFYGDGLDFIDFVDTCYLNAASIHSAVAFINKRIKWYEFYNEQIKWYDTDENEYSQSVSKIEIIFYDSY